MQSIGQLMDEQLIKTSNLLSKVSPSNEVISYIYIRKSVKSTKKPIINKTKIRSQWYSYIECDT